MLRISFPEAARIGVFQQMQDPKFLLPRNVFVCFPGDHCVFLDLRRDEYWCLSRKDAVPLGGMVAGWPVGSSKDRKCRTHNENDIDARVTELLEAGLLTTDRNGGKWAQLPSAQSPKRAVNRECGEEWESQAIGPGDIAHFSAATAHAALRLRWSHIENTVHGVACRKRKRAGKAGNADTRKTVDLVSRFVRLRPWFPRPYLCLFDSLALIQFLARHDVYPTWVFGVRTKPFNAHCWVQLGDLLLNDSLERVRSFTPIMAI